MKLKEFTEETAKLTLDHAKEWNELQDKFVYCVDFLGISAWDNNADYLVNRMEDMLIKMLRDASVQVAESHADIEVA